MDALPGVIRILFGTSSPHVSHVYTYHVISKPVHLIVIGDVPVELN